VPKIKYKELAAALRQDFGNDVANLDDLTIAQNWVNDNPDKADLIEFNVESPPTKGTGNLMEDLKSAPPLPRTKVAFQRERGGVEVPFIPQQFGFQGGEMVQPARPGIDESSLESPFVQVDSEPVIGRGTEILPTKFSNTIEGRNIGKKDPKSIEDYFKNIAKEGAVGSESDFGEEMRLANTIRVSEAFATDYYNENYPDAPLSFDDIKASLSNPEFANERNAAIDNINSAISKANWYGAMDLQDEYNQYAELANQLQADFDAKFGDFERSYAGYEQSVKKYGIPEAQGRLAEINERVRQQAKELDETNFFGKASLAASRLVGGGGYLLADFAGALGATDIADKMKSSLMDNLLASKDPRLAVFKAPYDPKAGQFVEGGLLSANTLGFVFEQGLNMIPSIVAAATPYGRLGQLAVGAIGTAALTYDEYAAEIDQAALQAGAKIDPQTRAIFSAIGAAKTGLIENAIPINRFFKTGMSKAFSQAAMRSLASGKSFDFAIKAGIQGLKAFSLTSGVEVAEELLDQGTQESINASITNQFPELKGQPQFEEKSLEDYAGIAVNTLVAVAPLGGVGFAYSGSRLKEDLFHNVARNNKVEVTLDLFEQNKDKFKDSQYKKNVDRLSLIGNIYSQIPEDIDDVSARKVADKMLEIESINSKMDKNTPQAIRERNTAKIDKINQEISSIFNESEISQPITPEAASEGISLTDQITLSIEDGIVLDLISTRFEPIVADITTRINNAEEIDVAELESAAEALIDEQTKVLESESLSDNQKDNLSNIIESQIDNLLNYEFATTTTTEQAGEARQVKGVIRTAKPGVPQKISTDRFVGVQVTNPKTGEQGRLVVTRVPITQSRTGLKYQFVPNSEMKKIKGGEYNATQGNLSVDEGAFPSTPFTNMQWVSSNFDQNGNLSSVVVRDVVSGNELRIDDQDLALDIAIAESQRQIGTVPEGAILSTAQKVVPMERLVKAFPNLRETGTAPEAVGVQPQTEQDVRQETNVTQERGDEGEASSRVSQEEGRQEGQVIPAVEGEAQASPTAKKPVQEKPTTQPDTQAKSVKSSAQKAAKSLSNWVKGGESRGLGIANLPEQDAERFKKFTEDVGELISALINNGVTRASTALKIIKPYFAENGPQFSKYASRFFKDEFNLAIIDRYPDLYKKAQGLEKKLEKALTQKEKLLAKDVEEARNSIIEKIKLRLNPSSWSKAKSGILAKAKLTNESISELKLYSEIFNDESLSQMDGKELKALYNEINSIFKSGARSQSATNKILSNHNKSLKERSIIAISNSLGTSEKVNDYKSAEEKSKRPGVAFYIIDNESGQIQEVDRKNISEWKDFFESNSYSVIAIDTNRNTLRNKSLLGRLGKFASKLKFDHLFDTRNIVAVFSNNDESYDFFEKNFIDLIWKADFNRDELKQQIGRFDKISEKLKNAGFNIDISKKVKSIVLRIGDVYAEGTNEDGLTIGQIIDTFMMLRDPDALVRAGGEGLVNYNKEDIDSIIDYVLNDEGLMRAVSEITQAYQDFLNEQILPTLTNYGYSTISFDPKQYNKNSSFSKNPDENARAIEILNKVYSNNIPQSIPYSPLSIVGDDAMIDESIDVLSSPNKDGVMSVMSNNVISRGDGGQIVFSNVAYKYNNYMDGMIDMVTRMPLLNNAKAMFGKEQMTLIKNKYGEAGADSIKSNVQRVVTNKSSKIEAKIIGEGVANWVNRSVLGQMWFNTRAALFQPIATLNFAPLAPSIGKYLSSVKSMNWISTTKEIQSMSWVKERFGGRIFSIDARELERRTKDGQIDIFSLVDKMLKIGYTPTAVFDFLSIVIGGGPLYDSIKNERYKEYIKTMDESSARIAAQNDASFELYKATNASQQSGNNMLISNAQRNPLLRLLMSYQTASQQMMRGAILSAQLLSKGIGDPARHAYIMLQFGLISTALFTLVSRTPELVYGALGFGDDDEDKDLKKSKRQKESESKYYTELLSGFFSGFGVPGNLMFAVGIKPFITDSFDQEKYDEVSAMEKFNMAVEKLSDYISAGAPGLSIKFRQFGDSAESFDEGEILRGIANAGSALAGIPLARLFEIFDQFAEAATRDYNAMERMLRATDIFNKSWSEKHYQEQVLKGKIEPKTKIEKNEIQKSNIEELNSMMKDLGFRAARQTGAERDKSLDKVKRYTDYAAREYSMTQDQYEGLVKNFNKGYFTGQVPDEFLDFARLSSESKVKAIAKKINSIDGLKERSNYIIRLDSANVGNDILSESEIEKVRNLLDDK
jgi:hypothetical protein